VRLSYCAALALLWTVLWCSHARAAEADAIRLDLEDCEDITGSSVRELAALELAPSTVLAAESTEPAATRAQMSCQSGVAAIVVEDVGRAEPLRLEITLRDLTRSARPRLLALAVAELIATSRLQRQPPKAREPLVEREPEASAPSSEPPVASASARWGVQLWLGVGAARVARPSMIAPLAALGVIVFWDALALTADLRFERAQLTQSIAELQLDAGSLALTPAWRLHASSADLLIGAGVRAGFASLRGSSRDAMLIGESVAGFWLAPCGQIAVQVRLARSWALRVGVEAAYVTRTLRGFGVNGESMLELRGLSLAAQLGVSWDLSASKGS
jgi:hypothetical protein